MDARNFRYLFENTLDGIVQSGSIWDTVAGVMTNYVYMCGMPDKKETSKRELILRCELVEKPCHIFVLASFSVYYIRKLLRMLRTRKIETVLLPYLAPVQRFVATQWNMKEVEKDSELRAFIDHPYQFLREAGIENIYLMYGNGDNLDGDVDRLELGHHFDLVEAGELETVRELEGEYLPIVKSGYIVENNWLFYFGQYGRNITSFEQFSKDCGERKKNLAGYLGSDKLHMMMRQITHEYTKRFGSVVSSVVMFHGPLHSHHREIDSVMTGKVFSKEQACIPEFAEDGRNCLLKCTHRGDFATYCRHKDTERDSSCFGTLLLGNLNMNRFFPEFSARFRGLASQVRSISLPGCGSREYWNRQCLTWMYGEDLKYWICGLDRETSSAVIADVVVATPKNRIVTVSEEYGYCFSGYLVPAVERR